MGASPVLGCILIVPSFPEGMHKIEDSDCKFYDKTENCIRFCLNEDIFFSVHKKSEYTKLMYPYSSIGDSVHFIPPKWCRIETLKPVVRFLKLYNDFEFQNVSFLTPATEVQDALHQVQVIPRLEDICRISVLHALCAGANYASAATLQGILTKTLTLTPGIRYCDWLKWIHSEKNVWKRKVAERKNNTNKIIGRYL